MRVLVLNLWLLICQAQGLGSYRSGCWAPRLIMHSYLLLLLFYHLPRTQLLSLSFPLQGLGTLPWAIPSTALVQLLPNGKILEYFLKVYEKQECSESFPWITLPSPAFHFLPMNSQFFHSSSQEIWSRIASKTYIWRLQPEKDSPAPCHRMENLLQISNWLNLIQAHSSDSHKCSQDWHDWLNWVRLCCRWRR